MQHDSDHPSRNPHNSECDVQSTQSCKERGNGPYRVRFSAFDRDAQTAILCRVVGPEAAGAGDGGRVIVDGAPVSVGREASVTEAGDTRFFAGWRSDPFFCDVDGAKNKR